LIVIAIAIAGLAFEQETVEVLGDTGTQAITSRLKDADRPREGPPATVLCIGALVLAALGVVVH
jgi:hypothetical protein